MARTVHVGRQPVYNREGALAGYELLFRAWAGAQTASASDAFATSQVLVSAFAEFGLDRLVGGRLCFVNVTREFLVGELPLPFPPDRVVLEVLGREPVDDAVVAGVAGLVESGYPVALDDFVFTNASARLLRLASYVKINIAGVSPPVLTALVTSCRLRPQLKLIAEHVESDTDLALARKLGFELFQGYALGRPQVVSGAGLAPSQVQTLRLLSLLGEAEADLDEIGPLVEADPGLAYRLLRLANSAAAGLSRPVGSVRDAAVVVGLNRLRQWLTLMAVADVSSGTDRAAPLMVRAGFCRRIAEQVGTAPDAAFTVGLLDGVCEHVGLTAAALVAQLPVTDEIAAGLVHGTGPLGAVLALAREYEAGQPPPELADGDLSHAYLDTLRWLEDLADAVTSADA